MRLLVDEDVPHSVAEVFQERGHEIVRVKQALGKGTPDAAIVTHANNIEAIVVTWNRKDFQRLVSRTTWQPLRHVGLISFCCEQAKGVQRAQQCIGLIEAAYGLAQERKDKRVFIEVRNSNVLILI